VDPAAGLTHLVDRAEFDRVLGTSLFAHAAEAAAKYVDLELNRVILLIRTFGRFDMDAPGWADRRAKHARRAVLNPVDRLDVMHPPKAFGIVPPLFRVLNGDFPSEKHLPK